MSLKHSFDERVLFLAPTGKDSVLLESILGQHGIKSKICSSLFDTTEEASRGVGAIIIAEEGFAVNELPLLKKMIDDQPSWSDVPIMVLTSGGEGDQTKIRDLNAFATGGNLILLGRPLHTSSLISVLEVAMRSRRRQYEVRELLNTQKKDHDALKKITEDLAKSNMNLDQFASIASHDLQEPLRKIRTFADRLKAKLEFLGEAERDYFQRIESAASRMAHLINSLLDYSRVSSDIVPLQPVDLREIANEVLSDLEIVVAESHAHVSAQNLPVVRANRFQMRQLFQNLISNAIKYSRKEVKPEIKLSVEADEERLLIFFKDNGIGLEEKYADRIFKPFQRLHGNNEYKGTGMGLAICDKIARFHGGRIRVSSVPGEGSTFTVDLPAGLLISEETPQNSIPKNE